MYAVMKLLRSAIVLSLFLSSFAIAQYLGGAPLVYSADPSVVNFDFSYMGMSQS